MDVQDRELTQAEYKQYRLDSNMSQLKGKRASSMLVFFMVCFYLYWDYAFLGWEHPALEEMLWSRSLLSFPPLVFIYFASFSKTLAARLDQWTFAAALLLGVGIILNMYEYGQFGYQLRIDGLLLYTFILYCLPGLHFRQRMLIGIIMLLMYYVLMSSLVLDDNKLSYDLVYLLIFNIAGGSLSRSDDTRSRREYRHKLILKRIADTDQLTGIYNRHGFEGRMIQLISQVDSNKALLALVVLDIDFFKKLNDSLGHIRGDCCLREVAQTLLSLREHESDLVVRFGGEEFIVVFYQSDGNRKRLLNNVNKICPFIEGQKFTHPNSLASPYVTVSAGVCVYEAGSVLNRSQLMYNADKALYFSKDTGRNRCSIAGETFGEDVNVVSISAYQKSLLRIQL